jgi:DNA-binding beta-propeller fold protein YncE
LWLGLLALNGCLVDMPPGPDLGPCAAVPEGVYGYGEAGIGTCLSGPADLVFFQQDGGTFLAVTNADPYRTFRAGSVLVIDWDTLVNDFLSVPAEIPDRILMSDIAARALEISDDDDGDKSSANAYLGGFGYLPEHQAAIVSSRLTEGLTAAATANGLLRVGKDELYVLDLTDMELPGGDIRLTDELLLEDDPFPVVVDDATKRAFVGNLTDHSVSVLSTEVAGDSDAIVSEIDVAPGPTTTLAPFVDADESGSEAVVSSLVVQKRNGSELTEDLWTLTFVEGTVRAWVPTYATEGVDAVVRWSSGDARTWLESPFGFETFPGAPLVGGIIEPFLEVNTDGNNVIYFAQADGVLKRAYGSPYGESSVWVGVQDVLTGGHLGSPSVAPLAGEVGLYADQRTAPGEDAHIVLATSLDGSLFGDEITVLQPLSEGTSYEDPFVAYDSQAGRYRMWLTVRTGDRYEIAMSQSEDGLDWSDPVTVLSDPDNNLASPTVAVLEGRYGMWLARDEGDRWDHVFAWSYDGVRWTEPELAIPGQLVYDPADPPRMGVLVDRVGGWRIEGADSGGIPLLLAAGTLPELILGFELAVANGQELDNAAIPNGRANLALVPGSAITTDEGDKRLYVTTVGAQTRSRLAVMEERGGELVYVGDLMDGLGLGAGQSASDPVVVRDGTDYVLYFTLWEDDQGLLRRATSTDGLTFTLESGNLLAPGEFDAAAQRAHSAQVLEGGAIMLWYTGDDGSQLRIGSARADSPTGRFVREEGDTTEWRLGSGLPGSFDDSSVQDPLVIDIDGATHLYYAGWDGVVWHIGHATLAEDGSLERPTDELSGLGQASLSGLTRTFSAAGVDSPVLWEQDDGGVTLLYAGSDGLVRRIGRASLRTDTPEAIFAEQRFPTSDDTLSFETTRGGPGAQVIELAQIVDEFTTSGFGMTALALDEERGFLYVTTKLDDVLYVLDVRDDSSGTFVDSNFLDVEALVVLDTGNAAAGARDVIVSPTRGLAYVTLRSPDGLAVLDLTRIPDDGLKEQIVLPPASILPLQSALEDAGSVTVAQFSGGRSALTPDERLLLVPHFRGNALSIFDLQMSAWGQEVGWLPNLGENPHVVKVSPDGRWAVVANYLGDVVDQSVSSTLAIVDVDPSSERYLEVVAWLANR